MSDVDMIRSIEDGTGPLRYVSRGGRTFVNVRKLLRLPKVRAQLKALERIPLNVPVDDLGRPIR